MAAAFGERKVVPKGRMDALKGAVIVKPREKINGGSGLFFYDGVYKNGQQTVEARNMNRRMKHDLIW